MSAVVCRSSFGIALLVLVVLGAFGATRAGAQTAVTTCGQEVAGDGYLTGDLNCPPDVEIAVLLQNGHLDMAGFAIRGAQYGVFCAKHTDAVTPGGEEIYTYINCSVANGTIADQSVLGIDGREVRLENVTVAPAAGFATIAHKRLRFTNLTIQLPPGGVGFHGTIQGKIEGTHLSITGGAAGIVQTSKVRIDDLTLTGYSDHGIDARSVLLENATLTGSGAVFGLSALTVRLESSTVTGNDTFGVAGHMLKARNSTITGNGTDVQSDRAPKLKNTTCDTSNGWGVCAND